MSDQEFPYASRVGFASTDQQAAARYAERKSQDPFSDVSPALLNSGDIADYVAATGMIFPFNPEEEKLKPASYEVDFLGRCVVYREDTREAVRVTEVERGQEYVLGANEIAFVQLEPFFRLPEYIAMRFNLRITNVYRGWLVGTGPLVDPGFQGNLWVPLHNLTASNYTLVGGDGLVWMEFTKLSRRYPEEGEYRRQKYFMGFPETKNERRDVMDYLQLADPHRPIRSSIPVLFRQATDDAANASRFAEDARQEVRNVRNIFTVGGLAVLVAILLASWALVTTIRDRAEDALRKVDVLEQKVDQLGPLQQKVDQLEDMLSKSRGKK